MFKFFVWTFLLSLMWWEAEIAVKISQNEILIEIIRIISNVVVLIIAPYLAWKIKQSEEDRKAQSKVAQADRSAIMDKLDKNTEVNVKATQKVIETAALPELERVSKPIVIENQEYFDRLLREYQSETHPERYLSAEKQRESSQEKEGKEN